MKIVICNYRYFVSGGPERYMFSLIDLLNRQGHEIIPFSVSYSRNQESQYSHYFVNPPGGSNQVYFKEMNLTLFQKAKAAMNAIYSFDARKRLETVISECKPDLIQTLQIHTVLSYSLFDAAHKFGVPVVARLSNYQLMCPSEHFLRDSAICEKCKTSLLCSVRYRCVQHSFAVSTVRMMSLCLHRLKSTFDRVNCFIVPSSFLKQKMIEYGFPESQLVHVPTFVPVAEYEPVYDSENYIVYIGRIAIEKGVHLLIRAMNKVSPNLRLIMIGNHESPEAKNVFDQVADCDLSRIDFIGYKPIAEIKQIIKDAMFTICPSIWYENNPNSIYESFAMGKPVIGSNLGSIKEQIIVGETGLLFEPGSVEDLADKINELARQRDLVKRMGKAARRYVETEHSPEIHYERLNEVYQRVLHS
ncbi:glycosyltransferase family 4 protein [candidate division KSB1 bacterium]|nr:glycosyltransferase family 4 protein [candidate division KSB1 bacterium]